MRESKIWLVVFDAQKHGDPILDFPVTEDNCEAERRRLEKQYPGPRYSINEFSGTAPIKSGIAEAKSWEASDYFSEMIHDERERQEREALQQNEVLILLGGPGAGKGTQGKRLAAERQLTLISTGELLRDEVRRGTPLGQQVATILNTGGLVADDVMINVIRQQLQSMQPGLIRVLFDGFPRTLGQAQALDALLTELSAPVKAVLFINLPDEELRRRMLGRAQQDAAQGTSVRQDDNEVTAENRIQVFHEQIDPLLDYYQPLLRTRSGSGEVDEVYERLKWAVTSSS